MAIASLQMLAHKLRRPSSIDVGIDHRSPIDAACCPPSPTSVLERDPKSPKGWRKRDSDGVGLGIVAVLERECSGETLARLIVGNSNPRLVDHAAINRARDSADISLPDMRSWNIFQPANFLENCHLCRKTLHGKDIYMYRGEKAFCSTDCRYQQIMSDEYQERCRPEASVGCDGKLFFTEIVAV